MHFSNSQTVPRPVAGSQRLFPSPYTVRMYMYVQGQHRPPRVASPQEREDLAAAGAGALEDACCRRLPALILLQLRGGMRDARGVCKSMRIQQDGRRYLGLNMSTWHLQTL